MKIELDQLAFKIAATYYARYRLIRDKDINEVFKEDLPIVNYIKKYMINDDYWKQEIKQGYDSYECVFSIEQLQEKVIYFIEALNL